MKLTLPEEMLLVSSSLNRTFLTVTSAATHGVAGAALMELALHGRVVLDGKRLVAVDGDEPDAPEVSPEAETLWKLIRSEKRARRPETWVERGVVDGAYAQVRSGLAGHGVLTSENRRVMWVFPSVRWSESDPVPRAEIRARLTHAMHGIAPDPRTVALLLLLDAGRLPADLFPELSSRARKARIAELAASTWENESVAETVGAVAKGVNTAIRTADETAADA